MKGANNMKKLIALLLCLVLTVCVITACTKGGEEEQSSENTTNTTEPVKDAESDASTSELVIPASTPEDPYVNDALFPSFD